LLAIRWALKDGYVAAFETFASASESKAIKPPLTPVARLLRKMGYSLQVAKKKQAGAQHPDRDKQFKYIAALKAQFLGEKLPVISIDTKKKELIGNYRREGKSWRRQPLEVDSYFASYA
jgi:hypothetical protein